MYITSSVSIELKVLKAFSEVKRAQESLERVKQQLEYAENDEEKEAAEKLKKSCLRDIDSQKTLAYQLKLQGAINSGELIDIESELGTILKERISGCSILINEVSC